jgi:hypothetical protein
LNPCLDSITLIFIVRYAAVDWIGCITSGGKQCQGDTCCLQTYGVVAMGYGVGWIVGVFGFLKLIDYYFTDVQQQTLVSFLSAQQNANMMLEKQADFLREMMRRVQILTEALNFQRQYSQLEVHVHRLTGDVVVLRKDGTELSEEEKRLAAELQAKVDEIFKGVDHELPPFEDIDLAGEPVGVLAQLLGVLLEGTPPEGAARQAKKLVSALTSPTSFKLKPWNMGSAVRMRYNGAWSTLQQFYKELRKRCPKKEARAMLDAAASQAVKKLADVEAGLSHFSQHTSTSYTSYAANTTADHASGVFPDPGSGVLTEPLISSPPETPPGPPLASCTCKTPASSKSGKQSPQPNSPPS